MTPHHDEPAPDGDSAGFSARLERWAAEARIDEAALSRARERWLREVAEQEATFAGVLTDLAERRTPVTVQVQGGRRHHGVVRGLGADFVVLGLSSGADVLVAAASVSTVRTGPDLGATLGDRSVGTDLRLADILTELAIGREPVVLVTRDGETIAGQLRSVGRDVLVLRTDAEHPATAYVPLTAVTEVTLA